MLKFVYNLFITLIMLYICSVQEIVLSSLTLSIKYRNTDCGIKVYQSSNLKQDRQW